MGNSHITFTVNDVAKSLTGVLDGNQLCMRIFLSQQDLVKFRPRPLIHERRSATEGSNLPLAAQQLLEIRQALDPYLSRLGEETSAAESDSILQASSTDACMHG